MNEIIKKNGVNFGIILGLFSILFLTTIYVINLELFTSWWLGLFSIAVSITIGFVLVSKTKKQLNGNITFKEAFSVYFLAAVIGTFLSTAYNYILFNFIDPQAKETIKEITMKYTAEMLQKFGSPAEAVNETMRKIAETDNYSLGNMLFGFAIALVFQAIFGLILAAIFKSKSNQGL